jgi:hypothetical protein
MFRRINERNITLNRLPRDSHNEDSVSVPQLKKQCRGSVRVPRAFGCVVYQMIAGRFTFNDRSDYLTWQKVKKAECISGKPNHTSFFISIIWTSLDGPAPPSDQIGSK